MFKILAIGMACMAAGYSVLLATGVPPLACLCSMAMGYFIGELEGPVIT